MLFGEGRATCSLLSNSKKQVDFSPFDGFAASIFVLLAARAVKLVGLILLFLRFLIGRYLLFRGLRCLFEIGGLCDFLPYPRGADV